MAKPNTLLLIHLSYLCKMDDTINFDGSMTPPLSDDEKENDLVACHSPVLHRHNKTVLRSMETTIGIRTEPCNPVEDKTDFSDFEETIYGAKLHLFCLEKQCGGFLPTLLQPNDVLKDLFQKCSSFCSKCKDDLESLELLCQLLELFMSLSSEASLVVRNGPKILYHPSIKNRFSDEVLKLHNCSNMKLIDWFHCFCDVNSQLLDIAHMLRERAPLFDKIQIYQCNGTNVLESDDVVVKVVSRILHESAVLSSNCFKEIISSVYGHLKWSTMLANQAYPCECFINLTKKCMDLTTDKNQFWNIITSIINSSVQATMNNDAVDITYSTDLEFLDTASALSFAWWWIGSQPLCHDVPLCHNLINRLMRLSLSHCLCDEEVLVFHIKCYVLAMKLLRASTVSTEWKSTELASFHLLWRHFSLKLSVFEPKALTGIRQYTQKEFHVMDWLSELNEVGIEHSSITATADSFQAFLCVLDFVLRENDGEIWSQLKDRLFSRLQTSTMKQLNEVGLHRYFSLVIIIVHFCPLRFIEDALLQSISALDQCSIERYDYRKQKLVITGLYAVTLTCLERDTSFDVTGKKLGKIFSRVCRLIGDKEIKKQQWFEVNKIFLHYLELFASVMRLSRRFTLGQVMLLPHGCLTNVLEALGPSEQGGVFNFITEIFSTLRLRSSKNDLFEETFYGFCVAIISEVLPWIKKQISCSNIDQQLCDSIKDVACDATLLTLPFNRTQTVNTQIISFTEVWKHFASDGHANPLTRCQYISTVLSDARVKDLHNKDYTETMQAVKKSTTAVSICDVTMQGWIKCNILLPPNHEALHTLNYVIAKLDVAKLFMSSSDDELIFENFLHSLSEKHKHAKNFLDKVRWNNMASRWFGPAVDSVTQVIKQAGMGKEALLQIYSVLGTIFLNCSLQLYTLGKPSFISRICGHCMLDPFHLSSTNKRPNSIFEITLLHSLHKFLLGLIRIGIKDFFIKSTLKKVTALHLTRWPCTSLQPQTHPFLRVLLEGNCSTNVVMLSIIHDVIKMNSQTEALATVVEILHEWTRVKNGNANCLKDAPDLRPMLQQARAKLRFNETLLNKTNHLLGVFNSAFP
ncbi:protein MMS22-like isoform X1 [Clavelina lepadiformis]|uniref:protein MMS22-like isoform X1 n=2 Tax=Clavelina lepadiformis TaxID=159417 RepID=UPI0040420AC7